VITLPTGYYMKRRDILRLIGNEWSVVVYCDPDCRKTAFYLAKVPRSPEYDGTHYMATIDKQSGTSKSQDLDALLFQMAARHRIIGGIK